MPALLKLPPQSRQPVTDTQPSFASGLCQVTSIIGGNFPWPGNPAACTRPDQAVQLTNYRLFPTGAATKRFGTIRTMTSGNILPSAAVSGIFWPRGNAIAVATSANGLYWGNAASGLPTFYVAIGGSVVNGIPSFAIFPGVLGPTFDVLYQADANGLHGWDGSTYTAPVGVPTVTGICTYNQRLWGWTGTSNSLYYSDLSTATGSIGGDSLGVGASGGGVINVQTFGISNIIACVPCGASLLIFQQHGVSRLTGFGQDDISVAPQALSSEVQLIGPRAYAAYENVVYVVTVQGMFRVFEGAVERVGTSEKPDPTIYPVAAAWGNGLATGITAIYNPNTTEVWVDMNQTSSAGYEGTYVYNTTLSAWSGPWTGRFKTINGFVRYPGYTNVGGGIGLGPKILVLDDLGYVLDTDYTSNLSDDLVLGGGGGTTYATALQCHRMVGTSQGFPTEPSVSKSWDRVVVVATMDTNGTSPQAFTTTPLSGSVNTTLFNTLTSSEKVYYLAAGGAGGFVDVTIQSQTGTTPITIHSVSVEGKATGRR